MESHHENKSPLSSQTGTCLRRTNSALNSNEFEKKFLQQQNEAAQTVNESVDDTNSRTLSEDQEKTEILHKVCIRRSTLLENFASNLRRAVYQRIKKLAILEYRLTEYQKKYERKSAELKKVIEEKERYKSKINQLNSRLEQVNKSKSSQIPIPPPMPTLASTFNSIWSPLNRKGDLQQAAPLSVRSRSMPRLDKKGLAAASRNQPPQELIEAIRNKSYQLRRVEDRSDNIRQMSATKSDNNNEMMSLDNDLLCKLMARRARFDMNTNDTPSSPSNSDIDDSDYEDDWV